MSRPTSNLYSFTKDDLNEAFLCQGKKGCKTVLQSLRPQDWRKVYGSDGSSRRICNACDCYYNEKSRSKARPTSNHQGASQAIVPTRGPLGTLLSNHHPATATNALDYLESAV